MSSQCVSAALEQYRTNLYAFFNRNRNVDQVRLKNEE